MAPDISLKLVVETLLPGFVLLKRRPFLQGRSPYALWSGAITAVIIFSFIFDIPDAAIYLDHMLGIGLLS